MICSICGLDKPETEFYRRNKSTCKECVKERSYNQRVERLKKYAEEKGIEYHPKGHIIKSNDPTLKWCNECKRFLPLSAFGHHCKKNGKRYINSCCKECMVKRVKDSPNREEAMLRSNMNKKARMQNDPEYREHIKSIGRKYENSERGILMTLLSNAKRRASLFNLEYNLSIEDISLPEKCPILGIPLKKGNVGGDKCSPSLDRIDPTKGYIKGNVQVISRLANAMKNNATPEELKAFANWVLANY